MSWTSVGEFLKSNAGTGAALIGSLLTGNLPSAVAAGVSLIARATGEADPDKALNELKSNPEALIKLKALEVAQAESIQAHIMALEELRLKDKQAAHEQQQLTIRAGDSSADEYVRHTRPLMARQSWYATAAYVVGMEACKACGLFESGASMELAMVLIAPAAAYLGFRSLDKFSLGK